MKDVGLFEHIAATETEDVVKTRKIAAACHARVKNQLLSFVKQAGSAEERKARLELIQPDVIRISKEIEREFDASEEMVGRAMEAALRLAEVEIDDGTNECENCGEPGAFSGDGLCGPCHEKEKDKEQGRTADVGPEFDPGVYEQEADEMSPGDLPKSIGTETLEPDWDGMRAWVKEVAKTDPEVAHGIAEAMGSEAPDLYTEFDEPLDEPYELKNDVESPGFDDLGEGGIHRAKIARRPKLCPYHSEVVDVSLSAGDPTAGYNAMSSHAWGPKHCQGDDYEGNCNFKREMVTQSYWDEKREQADQRRQEREQQIQEAPIQDEVPDSFELSTEDDIEVEEFSAGDSLDGLLDEAPSAVGEGEMALASTQDGQDFLDRKANWCPTCEGDGSVKKDGKETKCPDCNGKGDVAREKNAAGPAVEPGSASSCPECLGKGLNCEACKGTGIDPKVRFDNPNRDKGFGGRDPINYLNDKSVMGKMALTAKDFVMIADAIATSPGDPAMLAEHFAGYLGDTNPNFDRERFIAAATGNPQSRRDEFRQGEPQTQMPIVESDPTIASTKQAGPVEDAGGAVVTEDLPAADADGLDEKGSPEMDKSTWKPNALNPDGSPGPVDSEMDGSPHPTVTQHPDDRADHDADFLAQTDAVTEQVDLPSDSENAGFTTEKNIEQNSTKTWSENNGGSPVTNVADADRLGSSFRTLLNNTSSVGELQSILAEVGYGLQQRDSGFSVHAADGRHIISWNPGPEQLGDSDIDYGAAVEPPHREQCLDDDGTCEGNVQYREPLSGTGRAFPRCDKHWEERLNKQQEINERYPSQAPSDFDPGYAGEHWDEDY